MASGTSRFSGLFSSEYRLLRLAYPAMDEFQGKVVDLLKEYQTSRQEAALRVLEIGCGDGFTTRLLLESVERLKLSAVDNEPKMLATANIGLRDYVDSGNLEIHENDALSFLENCGKNSFDAIVSVWTTHNFLRNYRSIFLKQCFRVLKPGGVFINGDKFAQTASLHKVAVLSQFSTFLDVYATADRLNFLREMILHNLEDEFPDRVMSEVSAKKEMIAIGFTNIKVKYRRNMEAVLVSLKPISIVQKDS